MLLLNPEGIISKNLFVSGELMSCARFGLAIDRFFACYHRFTADENINELFLAFPSFLSYTSSLCARVSFSLSIERRKHPLPLLLSSGCSRESQSWCRISWPIPDWIFRWNHWNAGGRMRNKKGVAYSRILWRPNVNINRINSYAN